MTGHISITPTQIIVEICHGAQSCGTVYDTVTIENLEDAANIMAQSMQLPSSDLARQCQLTHQRDQDHAMFRDLGY